jgi:hypothetical protein
MSLNLTNKDYINILKFYKLAVPRSKRLLKIAAEKVLNDKLCKCIKKVSKNEKKNDTKNETKNEKKSIAICTKSIFQNKGLRRGKFTCKKKRTLQMTKTQKNI